MTSDDDEEDGATDRAHVTEIPVIAQEPTNLPPETQISPGVEPGTVLAGKFKVERVINSGGMGVILVAHHLQLDQRVAIKVLRAHVLHDPEIVARFAREARVMAKIKSEHVVRVIDVGALPNGLPYMVMEHLQGSDLSALIKARGPMPYQEVVEYVLQACEALAEAHVAGVVHRDLKPANLFLTRRADGSPLLKVLDFGISKVVEPFDSDSNMTKTSMLMGSPQYMSPEQLRSARKVDGRADIWALGVVLYRLISGKNPFHAESTPELCVEILHGEALPLRQLVPEVPAGLERVIGRCLQKKPGDRYANVADLANALEPFAPARTQATIARIEGVYKASIPSKSVGPDFRKTASTLRDVSSDDVIDVTDAGARTVSEKSIAPSVSERVPRRTSRVAVYFGLGLAAMVGGWIGIGRLGSVATVPTASIPEAAASTLITPSIKHDETSPPIFDAPFVVTASTTARIAASHSTAHATQARSVETTAPSIKPSASTPESNFGGPF